MVYITIFFSKSGIGSVELEAAFNNISNVC